VCRSSCVSYDVESWTPAGGCPYSYHARFKDPTKKVHDFQDSGKVFVDALYGDVLNPPPVRGLGRIARSLKTVLSEKTRQIAEELESFDSIGEYEVKVGEQYRVRRLEPVISGRSARKSALDYVIEKNTASVRYRPKHAQGGNLGTRTIKYVPKSGQINLKGITLVYVPRWDITFEAFGRTYSREVLAHSGTVLTDGIKYCPEHLGPLRKENVALCEVCGRALCESHVSQCLVCGRWLCEEDGVTCASCSRVQCREQARAKCEVCNQHICLECKIVCPICGKTYGRRHTRVCDSCGRNVCPDCMTQVGFLRKRYYCSDCVSSRDA